MSKEIKVTILGIISILSCSAVFIFLRPIPQDQSFHNFADDRGAYGIPNFLNVTSNIIFIAIGLIGLTIENRVENGRPLFIQNVLFSSLILTGIVSAYYHLNPSNYSLIYDRMPLTVVFSSLLCLTISQYISERLGCITLYPSIIAGIGTVLYWYFSEQTGIGDLRPYLLIQFYPISGYHPYFDLLPGSK